MNEPSLQVPIEERLRPPLERGQAERMLRSFKLRQTEARRARQRRARRAVGLGSLAAAAILALAVGAWLSRPAVGPVALVEGHGLPGVLGSQEDPSVYDLDDGSRIVLAPRTEARVTANDASQLRATVARGRATFDVRPGGPRRWLIDAGDARVEVLGTRFSVARDGARTTVRVERGLVQVFHPSLAAPARLTAGQHIEVGVATTPSAMPSATPPATIEPVASTAEVIPSVEPVPEARPSREPVEIPAPPAEADASWRSLAERGEFEAAYARLGPDGLRRAARGVSPDDRLLLADVARRAGHPREAAPLLDAVARGGGERAVVAAFTLGRLQLDQLAVPREAAHSFHRVATQPGPLRADAMALEADAWHRSGDRRGAARAARAYLSHFDDGRHADRMRAYARW